ncbi:MAG: alpha/beta fold hydrolase [Candidatus Thiodiazotropha sp.]
MRRLKREVLIRCLLLLLIVSMANSLQAANLSREQRISEGLEARLSAGSAVWLEAESVRFLAIHQASSSSVRYGGAILLHDSNSHADWHEVINPLRRHLTKRGWETLSLQLPLGNPPKPSNGDSLLSLSRPRIQAAVSFLKQRQVEETVLIGHGLGGAMAMDFIVQQGEQIKGLVTIGVSPISERGAEPLGQILQGRQTSILDLYGSLDLPQVIAGARERHAVAAGSEGDRYRQERVSGADHFFSGMQDELNNRVAAWLRQAARQWQTTQPPSTP